VLRGTRTLPITAFIVATFYRVNQVFVERAEVAKKISTQLCPKVLNKIRAQQLVARGYQVSRFGPCIFEVNTGNCTYEVTINGRLSECVCQVFQLTGIPCGHMLACYSDQWHKTDFHTLCHEWYLIDMYRNAYASSFIPVPDKRSWSILERSNVLPPALRRKKGRPKSTRIHNSMDIRETEDDTRKRKCSHCSQLGHYKKRCPQIQGKGHVTPRVRGNCF
jgi:SWIM zinc finger